MSECQIVKFRAIDRPLTDKQLEFMDRQSSRAEFTKWEFEVDYHYGSFRGDITGMLRNGYDIFLNYSNYGDREIRIRLPNSLPFPKSVWSKYSLDKAFHWTADRKGNGGILTLAPCIEEAEPDWDFDGYLDAIVKLRELLIAGDLRVLYVLWLCCALDSELMEPPIPHGLATFPSQATELLPFFDVDPLLVNAAAIGIPAFQSQDSHDVSLELWLKSIVDSRRAKIIQRLLTEDPVALKAELLSEIRNNCQATEWPVAPPSRTMAQLLDKCESLRKTEQQKLERQAAAKAKREAKEAEKQRQARMAEMKITPEPWLLKASSLVEQRGTVRYKEAAEILSELREAIGGDEGSKIARKHAAHLAKKNPGLSMLKSSLKKRQLLD